MSSSLLRSTALRLTLLLGAAFLLSLLAAVLVAVSLTRHELDQRIDRTVLDRFTVISQSLGDNDEADLVDAVNNHAHAAIADEWIYLLTSGDGTKLAGNLPGPSPSGLGWFTVSAQALGLTPAADAYRTYTARVGSDVLLVGQSFAERNDIALHLLYSVGWGSLVLLALIAGAGLFIAVRAQGRLDAIAQTMERVGHGDLGARVPTGRHSDDLDALGRQINVALDRLGGLVDGMRQVSVDIAHELKTPMNRMAIVIEDALGAAEKGNAVTPLLRQVQTESRQINSTFDALLRIAQIESGARRARFVSLRIEPILETLTEAYADVATENGQVLSLLPLATLPEIIGDRDLLIQLWANVIENAIRHSPPGTEIRIGAALIDHEVTVTIADDGPGIPLEDHEKVFQRLYRVDKSRTTSGSGLGLSLVKAIADLHGAGLSLSDNEPGVRLTVRFPARAEE
jgi:signal transduction histidine kinase